MSQPARDDGFSLIEVATAMALASVLMAMAVAGYRHWDQASEHSGTARELQSLLRSTQQRALTEGNAMCVRFDTADDSYTVLEGTCAAPGDSLEGPYDTAGDQVELVAPSFAASTGPTTGVTFFARGTATAGSVEVIRDGSTKVYTVSVEGLTGRVSLS